MGTEDETERLPENEVIPTEEGFDVEDTGEIGDSDGSGERAHDEPRRYRQSEAADGAQQLPRWSLRSLLWAPAWVSGICCGVKRFM